MRSSTRTSGLWPRTWRAAVSASALSATTSQPGWVSSSMRMPARTTGWSSVRTIRKLTSTMLSVAVVRGIGCRTRPSVRENRTGCASAPRWRRLGARDDRGMTAHVVIAGGGVGALEGAARAAVARAGPAAHQRSIRRSSPDVPRALGRRALRRRSRAALRVGRDSARSGGPLDPRRRRGRASRRARDRHARRTAGPLRRTAAGARGAADAGPARRPDLRRPARRARADGCDRRPGARAAKEPHRVRLRLRHELDAAAVRARPHDRRARAARRREPGRAGGHR